MTEKEIEIMLFRTNGPRVYNDYEKRFYERRNRERVQEKFDRIKRQKEKGPKKDFYVPRHAVTGNEKVIDMVKA